MHRVVTLNTLCSIASIFLPHNTTGSFQSHPTGSFQSHPLSSRKTMYFRTYELLNFSQGINYVTFSQVRWANLQSTSVKFLQDAVCQKSLKSVNI